MVMVPQASVCQVPPRGHKARFLVLKMAASMLTAEGWYARSVTRTRAPLGGPPVWVTLKLRPESYSRGLRAPQVSGGPRGGSEHLPFRRERRPESVSTGKSAQTCRARAGAGGLPSGQPC